MRKALTDAVITVPDGMPIVWAANMLGEDLPNRVYGPELMHRYCERSVERGHRVWLYGGRDQGALVQLALTLRKKHPGIQIVGGYSPPFRALTEEEDDDDRRPDQRGAAGRALGGDRRAQAGEVDGAHARSARRAGDVRRRARRSTSTPAGCRRRPRWMQERGLEWTYRIAQEPRRLLPRYLYTNPRFMLGFLRQYLAERRAPSATGARLPRRAAARRLLRAANSGRRRRCSSPAAGGFAGAHLVERARGPGRSVTAPPRGRAGPARSAPPLAGAAAAPTCVFHLAAFSSPRLSWERPRDALVVNIEMTLNLLEAVRARRAGGDRRAGGLGPGLRGPGRPAGRPRSAPLAPGNPYAVSKAACDLLGAPVRGGPRAAGRADAPLQPLRARASRTSTC